MDKQLQKEMTFTWMIIVLLCGVGFQANGQDEEVPPDYVTEGWEERIGEWIADNSRYTSADEPIDAYGIEWKWGFAKKSIRGRLYGIQNGKEIETYWEFLEVWHPGERKVLLFQFGSDGTFATGSMVRKVNEHTGEIMQTFYAPDGSVSRTAHRTETRNGKDYGQSFTVLEDGTWKERRSYLWEKHQ